jgi:hypothetical protein
MSDVTGAGGVVAATATLTTITTTSGVLDSADLNVRGCCGERQQPLRGALSGVRGRRWRGRGRVGAAPHRIRGFGRVVYPHGCGGDADRPLLRVVHALTWRSPMSARTSLSGASAAIPTYQAGDLLIVAGWRPGSFLDDPSGWTLVVGATANNYYATAWSKVAASGSSSDVVTLTGASYIGVWVCRGASGVGASAVNVFSTTYPGLTLQQSGGASWVMSMGMGRTVQPATPAGMTSRSAVSLDAGCRHQRRRHLVGVRVNVERPPFRGRDPVPAHRPDDGRHDPHRGDPLPRPMAARRADPSVSRHDPHRRDPLSRRPSRWRRGGTGGTPPGGWAWSSPGTGRSGHGSS